ncbi:hypothetical protein [Streptomyces sp. NBC_00841]|uniref:hypothetical protein n=1 Tax=Streptomyces sp. NBC_00841 TaxID=2975847 RepID=UPI003FA35114
METAERFRAAVEKGELAALDDLFTEDIRLYSPVRVCTANGGTRLIVSTGVRR